MTDSVASIRPLPPGVAAQIQSSTAITSLTGVVLDLMRNALDGNASRIEINVDFRRGGCTVEDDGVGILPAEFAEGGGLGRLHYTSKYENASMTHGRYGIFLASLAALALVTITSHHRLHRSHNTLTLHRAEPIIRLMPAPAHQHLLFPDHGTRVTVRDLFGSMPVRVKHRAVTFDDQAEMNKTWESLKRHITGLLIAWGRPVNLVLRDGERNKKFPVRGSRIRESARSSEASLNVREDETLNRPLIRSILCQAGCITPDDWEFWIPISASASSVSIKGLISLDPAPTKAIQFISLGSRPVDADRGNNVLYDQVNRLFAASSFGLVDDAVDINDSERERRKTDRRYKTDGLTVRQMKGGRKGVDRWPMFYLRLELEEPTKHHHLKTDDRLIESKLKNITEVLDAMIVQFLRAHNLRPRKARTKGGTVENENPLHLHYSTDTEVGVLERSNCSVSFEKHGATPNEDHPGTKRSMSSARASKRLDLKTTLSDLRPNMVGSNLKIPVLSRSRSDVGMGFREWSRIKSGRAEFYDEVYKNSSKRKVVDTSSASEPQKESTNGFQNEDQGISVNLDSVTQSDSSNGDAFARESRVGTSNLHSAELEASPLDEVVTWTNPASKTTYLISSRTGLVIPKSIGRPSSGPTPSPRDISRTGTPLSSLRNSSHLGKGEGGQTPSPWMRGLLQNWRNPVFDPTEKPIPHISLDSPKEGTSSLLHRKRHHCSSAEFDRAFIESSTALSGRFSKQGLKNAEVINQVDQKFVLVRIEAAPTLAGKEDGESIRDLLVLVDQHAADERCRIESQLKELCCYSTESLPYRSNLGLVPRIVYATLSKSITFHVSAAENDLFETYARDFANWGIVYDLLERRASPSIRNAKDRKEICQVSVRTLPVGIAARCQLEPKLLIDLLRGEVWKRHENSGGLGPERANACTTGAIKPTSSSNSTTNVSVQPAAGEVSDWVRRIGDCPRGILDLLNSRACRSAIMFNDPLTHAEASALIARLAECQFPFVCAHGRPSLVALVGLPSLLTSTCPAEPLSSAVDVAGEREGRENGNESENKSSSSRLNRDSVLAARNGRIAASGEGRMGTGMRMGMGAGEEGAGSDFVTKYLRWTRGI
ncbi:MAG: hypothetical protein M1819_005061 [Sarea resinae]|nr:MAG: hypothetical protein M1819_005061 [Sarea resinae]